MASAGTCGEIGTMVGGYGFRRASNSWWASCLSLVVYLGLSSDGLGTQPDLPSLPALPPEAEVALTRTSGEICVRTGEPPDEIAVCLRASLVRYLLDELIAQRFESAQLTADLADAKARRTQTEKASREKEAALAAWISGLHEELSQLADATAAQVSAARLLGEARAAEASARARRQLAAMRNRLKEQDRQIAIVRSVAEELTKRLTATEAELKHRDAENERLAAELVAPRTTTHAEAGMTDVKLAATEDQIDTPLERPGQPTELPSATSVDVFPTIPHPKPMLRAGAIEAWTLVSDTADGGAPAPREADWAIEDATLIQTGLHNVALKDRGPPANTSLSSVPERLEIPDTMSRADLAPTPFISRNLAPGERGPTALDQAAMRLVDGLRATREEAMLEHQERVFTVDVETRAFAGLAAETVSLDPAFDIRLLTAKSELVGQSKGRIRFFPDGSSTGGRIEIGLLGDRAAVNVQWSTGAVALER